MKLVSRTQCAYERENVEAQKLPSMRSNHAVTRQLKHQGVSLDDTGKQNRLPGCACKCSTHTPPPPPLTHTRTHTHTHTHTQHAETQATYLCACLLACTHVHRLPAPERLERCFQSFQSFRAIGTLLPILPILPSDWNVALKHDMVNSPCGYSPHPFESLLHTCI